MKKGDKVILKKIPIKKFYEQEGYYQKKGEIIETDGYQAKVKFPAYTIPPKILLLELSQLSKVGKTKDKTK